MIGIIGAMDVEVARLRSAMQDARIETVSGIDFHIGRIEGHEVALAKCGVGKVFAALCAQTLILKYGVRAILNSGVAGTLTPALHIGDVAVSAGCVQHDMDTTAVGDPLGLISGINMVELPADKTIVDELSAACTAAGVNFRVGLIATGDQFVHTSERRTAIASHFKAIAAEMEAGAIAQVCFVNRIPFAAIRVISDEASGEAKIDYLQFVKQAAATSADIAMRWLRLHA